MELVIFFIFILCSNVSSTLLDKPKELRSTMVQLALDGKYLELGELSISAIKNGLVKLDGNPPSAYFYLGISHFKLNHLKESSISFARAIDVFDNDLSSWLGLGESYLCQFEIENACWAYEQAIIVRQLTNDTSKLYKARSWIADWAGREYMQARLKNKIIESIANVSLLFRKIL